MLANGAEGRLQRWRQRVGGRRAGLGALLLGGFGLFERLQGQLPRVFQCGGNMAMRWIDVVELALTIGRLIAQASVQNNSGRWRAQERTRSMSRRINAMSRCALTSPASH